MSFNVLVGSNFFVHEDVERCILSLIEGKDIILIGNGNTLSTKSFRLHEELVQKLEASGARKVIYTELTLRNMSILKRTDIIYIMAGDVRELLTLYQNELFRTLIEKHVKKGILIAEIEAAVLLSKRIDWYLKECGIEEKTPSKGLGLLDENFYMHYRYEDIKLEEHVKQIEKKYHIELKRLTDDDCYFTSSIVK